VALSPLSRRAFSSGTFGFGFATERRGCVVTNPGLYSGDLGFRSRHGHRLYLLRFLAAFLFLHTFPGKISEIVHNSSHNMIYDSLFIKETKHSAPYHQRKLTSLLNEQLIILIKICVRSVASCRSCVNRRFGETYRLHLKGRKIRAQGTSVNSWLQTAVSSQLLVCGQVDQATLL
jgi:hypothetical protein